MGEGEQRHRDPNGRSPVTVRVMSFNIWLGGEQIEFGQVAEAIKAAEADVVGIQEAGPNLKRIADALGWHFAPGNERHQQIVSRFRLLPGQDPDTFVYALTENSTGFAISNVHLRAYPYGPHELRDGATSDHVLGLEAHHLEELAAHFDTLPKLAAAGIPVFLTGDHNVPSHLDWTGPAAAASEESFRTPFAWPLSMRLQGVGFRDSFREAHPDAAAKPGITWSPGYPPPAIDDDEVCDRIDYVYAAGPATTVSSQVVGEPGPQSDIAVDSWPSDHRAVVSEFTIVPAPVPHAL
ncbi:endonuclease/exonuclease/phosphatase family protein [Phytoactinopolyspora mesophila]|uniref:Endonuclease/exonuclease/phosphatase domain-containing protein n=1 Tax=Phytoactinopolyspora mesophila TaxID=2650750 RepID=A0A7K3LYM1_9ACTN|nr:endonuclease/exonuclease/phosphatase family protein [Phytoactinopolyspora mesophila]NDL55917.1 hypothetical protein [Phytoactinopolyspora mesophila]